MVGFHRKSLDSQFDISSMREMRRQGMTNKQIANALGCSIKTVYNKLGKRSLDVAFAEAKNLPAPVTLDKIAENRAETKKTEPAKIPEKPIVEKQVIDEPAKIPEKPIVEKQVIDEPAKIPYDFEVSEVHTLELTGQFGTYLVDQISGEVNFKSGLLEGIIDKDSLSSLILELVALRNKIGG